MDVEAAAAQQVRADEVARGLLAADGGAQVAVEAERKGEAVGLACGVGPDQLRGAWRAVLEYEEVGRGEVGRDHEEDFGREVEQAAGGFPGVAAESRMFTLENFAPSIEPYLESPAVGEEVFVEE